MKLTIFAKSLLGASLTVSAQQINLPMAQGTGPTGFLTGTICNKNKAVIVGTNVVIRGAHGTFKLRTNDEGKYRAEIPAGMYSIEVHAAGFSASRRDNFRVVGGNNPPFNVTMSISEEPVCMLTVSVKKGGTRRGRRNR